ncbi:phospholipase D [Staphylococcus haemolyticus]|jgi:cardiolipin synthase|uniref:Cardiolipin synthase n=1 Tax=Staphylococcus haemolyticus TaxID=1283 RepID=A0A7Z1N218_STAHA|nr:MULTISPECIES: cardiolipin synthase [Staphylococcus]KDP49605.1 cardiolipin synthetase [Staphylococcus aureus subsp. aureus CO-98]AYX83053.1 cardiolipin synthase [Staphylococcus haemolyticus]KKI58928.1 Cardiolipin synthetase [Staphylococcus haemolyticus]MBC3013138.1 cardiolipin synthase [Staphylococcus haemolyticus]MBC3114630.1 cardiolipin synthase [Staphylococcus haemolyticus]
MKFMFGPDLGTVFTILLALGIVINLVLAFIIIFLERNRRSASSTWAWLFVLFVLPLIGFILYLFFGRTVSKRKMEKNNGKELDTFKSVIKDQVKQFDAHNYQTDNQQVTKHRDLIRMLLNKQDAFLTEDNHIDLFTDGNKLYEKVIEDIYNAKNYIHLEYYTFELDGLGHRILDALETKLKEGLEVKILYDDVGSKKVRMSKFHHFESLGGEVEAFFASKFPLINFRMNNRNHRKIIVIDGQVGYIGGFNIGDDYLGLGKLGYWRDTHIRVEGDVIDALQIRFILDWNSQAHRPQFEYDDKYFPKKRQHKGKSAIQIASSGPAFDLHQIEYGYTKMIMSAKKSIYMQSPYFIPDQSYINALKMAANAGVDVHLMIPCKPDHPFVYWATFSYAAELLNSGVKIYTYQNGFIHSKVMMIDDEICSVGSANMDYRSFALNFEVNAFIYDEEIAKEIRVAYEDDIKKSKLLTLEKYNNRSLSIKVKEDIAKLVSPIL